MFRPPVGGSASGCSGAVLMADPTSGLADATELPKLTPQEIGADEAAWERLAHPTWFDRHGDAALTMTMLAFGLVVGVMVVRNVARRLKSRGQFAQRAAVAGLGWAAMAGVFYAAFPGLFDSEPMRAAIVALAPPVIGITCASFWRRSSRP